MGTFSDSELWGFIHQEREVLAEDLRALSPGQWTEPTLCSAWDVEHVLAHLSAAASTTQGKWLRSMVVAGFRPAVHNERRLQQHLGASPAQTLGHFESIINSNVAPTKDTAAYLGEVVVHAQDIRQPLGIATVPSIRALTAVAEFFASRNFAVPSRAVAEGLEFFADDGGFRAGSGPSVSGPTLALVMVMAGRRAYLDELRGPGVKVLRERLAKTL